MSQRVGTFRWCRSGARELPPNSYICPAYRGTRHVRRMSRPSPNVSQYYEESVKKLGLATWISPVWLPEDLHDRASSSRFEECGLCYTSRLWPVTPSA